MNFWEQFAISQGTAFLHVVIRKYAAKYFTEAELAATDICPGCRNGAAATDYRGQCSESWGLDVAIPGVYSQRRIAFIL
jgi:hypothetical protein